MSVSAALLTIALTQSLIPIQRPEQHLIASWTPSATYNCSNPALNGTLVGGVGFAKGPEGRLVFDFNGRDGAIEIPDAPCARLTGSLTVTAWVWVRDYTPHGSSPAGQIFFRGDDRCGLDPYHLTLLGDGRFEFGIDGEDGNRNCVAVDAKLEQWVFLTGSFNAETGAICLFCNGILMARTYSRVLPFEKLDPGWNPGLSIGNVQFPQGGRHWQPFNGYIGEVRLYDIPIEDPVGAGLFERKN